MSEPAPSRPSLLTEARDGVAGVLAMLTFRPDWRGRFNPDRIGVLRSFSGVVLALPAFIFTIAASNFFLAENPPVSGAAELITPVQSVMIWIRFWLLFPVFAFAICRLLDLNDRFGPWLVVHNWAVVILIHVQALFWAFYMAGLADPASLGMLLTFYLIGRLFVHWRVAQGALGLPPGLAAAAAGVPLVADLLIARALF